MNIVGRRQKKELREKRILASNQTGFREGMGMVDNICFELFGEQEIESRKEEKLKALFVDLNTAFDSVTEGYWKSR